MLSMDVEMRNSIDLNTLTEFEKYWTNDVTRLSDCLRNYFSNWTIVLHYSGLIVPTTEEQDLLDDTNYHHSDYYGRIITHNLGDEYFILGRVIMTLNTYHKYKSKLDRLNNHSIGDSILFHEPMSRSNFSVRRVNKESLQNLGMINKKLIGKSSSDEFLTRFSLFTSRNDDSCKIIVNEYFLKDISDYEYK
jgi:hypothetical protein